MTFVDFGAILRERSREGRLSQTEPEKKILANPKKALDKARQLCYNNKAAHLRGGTRGSNRTSKKILANRKKFLTNSSRSAKIAKLLSQEVSEKVKQSFEKFERI